MKKAQILSALALAFALGVVAPVSGVINSASVSAYNTEKDTATFADTTNAIAFVENDATYKAYVQIQDALQAYNTGWNNGTIADIADSEKDKIADVAGAISGALSSAMGVTNDFGYNTSKIGSDISAEKNFSKQIGIAVSAAEGSEFYNKLAAVIDLVDNAANNSTNNAKLVSAVTALRKYAFDNGIISNGDFDNLHPEKATISGYKTAGGNAVRNLFPGSYSEAERIMTAVDNANEALAKYKKGYDLFMPLLVNSSLLNQADKDAINGNQNIALSGVGGLASYATKDIVRGTYWSALYNEVQNVKAKRVSEESGDNYQLIHDLAVDWQAATGNEQKVEDVMARMVAYKAPAGTGDGTNKPEEGGNKAPDTGILADAEGSASTTVAMVAGVATALTAAGAGVVAYRNARRSTRK